MMCRNNNECLTGNICRKNRGINFGVCVSGKIFHKFILNNEHYANNQALFHIENRYFIINETNQNIVVSVFEARRPYYPTIYRNKKPNYNKPYMPKNALKPTTPTVQYFWGTPISESPSANSVNPVNTTTTTQSIEGSKCPEGKSCEEEVTKPSKENENTTEMNELPQDKESSTSSIILEEENTFKDVTTTNSLQGDEPEKIIGGNTKTNDTQNVVEPNISIVDILVCECR